MFSNSCFGSKTETSNIMSFPNGLLVSHSFPLLVQHEFGLAADEGVRHLVEQTEGEVSPVEKAAAMKAAFDKKIVALRNKMGKFVAVSNPEHSAGWLRKVGT